jgi:energy-coupling factor transport system permease protein
MRVTTAGVLDRALDIAAALEVRGYGAARMPPSQQGARSLRAWSRHDLAFVACGVMVPAIALVARIGRLAPFSAYPTVSARAGVAVWSVAALLILVALLPFADRRGVQ